MIFINCCLTIFLKTQIYIQQRHLQIILTTILCDAHQTVFVYAVLLIWYLNVSSISQKNIGGSRSKQNHIMMLVPKRYRFGVNIVFSMICRWRSCMQTCVFKNFSTQQLMNTMAKASFAFLKIYQQIDNKKCILTKSIFSISNIIIC